MSLHVPSISETADGLEPSRRGIHLGVLATSPHPNKDSNAALVVIAVSITIRKNHFNAKIVFHIAAKCDLTNSKTYSM